MSTVLTIAFRPVPDETVTPKDSFPGARAS
jgi:hypothetical protein